MANILRVTALWSGFQGAPGFTRVYFNSGADAQAAVDSATSRLRTFFESIKALLNIEYTVKVQRLVQVLNDANGALTTEINATTDPVIVTPTGTGVYSAAVGAAVNWQTGAFNARGRRIMGRSYIVPMNAAAFQNDGTLGDANITTILNAAAALIAGSPSVVVWTRPTTFAAADGLSRTVVGATCADKTAVLRSRRD